MQTLDSCNAQKQEQQTLQGVVELLTNRLEYLYGVKGRSEDLKLSILRLNPEPEKVCQNPCVQKQEPSYVDLLFDLATEIGRVTDGIDANIGFVRSLVD